MKLSNYCCVLRHKDCYLLHSTLTNNLLKLVNEEEISEFERMSLKGTFNRIEDSKLMNKLIDLGMMIDETVTDEAQLANIAIQSHNENLKVMIHGQQIIDNELIVMQPEVYELILKFIKKYVNDRGLSEVELFIWTDKELKCKNNILDFMLKFNRWVKKQKLNTSVKMVIRQAMIDAKAIEEFYKAGVRWIKVELKEDFKLAEIKDFHNKILQLQHLKTMFELVVQICVNAYVYDNLESYAKYFGEILNFDQRFSNDFSIDYLSVQKESNISKHDINERVLKIAKKYGLNLNRMGIKQIQINGMHCFSTFRHSFIFHADGRIKKCQYHEEDFGDVGEFDALGQCNIDEDKVKNFTAMKSFEKCLNCRIYPMCTGKRCPYRKYSTEYCDELIDYYYLCLEYMGI